MFLRNLGARRMAANSPAMACLVAVLVICAAFMSSLVYAESVTLVNYEFENQVPPNNTAVVSATPSGNSSHPEFQPEFGTIKVVTNVLREAMATDSKVLGSVVGLVNTLKDLSIYLTFNFVYESSEYNGTIGVQGRLSADGNGELVVTGGTGDFRFAQGYCETTLVAAPDRANIVFKNVVHLKLLGSIISPL